MKDKQICGCVHDGTRWLKMCDAHQAETAAVHARWAAEHAPAHATCSAEVANFIDQDGTLQRAGLLTVQS